MKKVIISVSALSALAAPVLAFAAESVDTLQPGLGKIANFIQTGLGYVVPILISFATIYFLYGVLQYVIKSDPEGKEQARHTMIYGIIGLAIMVSVWGLVRVVTGTFGLNDNSAVDVPELPQI